MVIDLNVQPGQVSGLALIKNIAISTCAIALLACNGQGESPAPLADLVLRNGNVITVDKQVPNAEAIAVVGDRIVAVGSNETIAEWIGESTEVVDVIGQTVIPGFIEGHGHFMSFGNSLMNLDFRYAKSFDEIVALVANASRSTPVGEWIIGRGWHQDKWRTKPEKTVEGLPLHDALSAVTPKHPVMLIHTSGHGIFVNQKAMNLVELDESTEPPEGGEIVRDEYGRATGMMRESAQDVFRTAYAHHQAQRSPEIIEADMRRMATLAGEEALRHGITSFQDLGTYFHEVDLLKVMAAEGKLPVRRYMAFEELVADMKDRLVDYRMVGFGNNFLTVRTIGEKVLDGALGTHGGWLLEPYADLPRSHGLNVNSIEEIEESARLAMEHDYQLAIQGIGDRAVRELFNIYEAEFAKHPDKKDLRWRIEHAQVIHPDDVPRFAANGVIPAVQGIFACSDGPWVEDRLGSARTNERGYIFNSLVESGAVPTNGTDPPVDEISPIGSFYCSVTRILPDGSVFQRDEVYSRELALYSYTMGNAFAAFEEDIKGSLTVGKLADITVLSQDLLTVPDDKIMDTEIVMTIVGGRTRYRDGEVVN